jgi:hypothetical protein
MTALVANDGIAPTTCQWGNVACSAKGDGDGYAF